MLFALSRIQKLVFVFLSEPSHRSDLAPVIIYAQLDSLIWRILR